MLEENLLIILSLIQSKVMVRTLTILSLAIFIPPQQQAGNMHGLGKYSQSTRYMYLALNALEEALIKAENNYTKFMNKDYIFNMSRQ